MTISATPQAFDSAMRQRVLDAFAQALNRETHNLTQRSDLLWQQLYNRLQWEEEPLPQLLAPEEARRTAPGSAPWLRLRTPFRESKLLIRTLAGHTGGVTACAISPDGSFIVSGSDDNTLKIWDAETGAERATLRGHEESIAACAISPDGRFIVSANYRVGYRDVKRDTALKVWDVRTGVERATLPGHAGCVTACAVSPDGRFIVSASEDYTFKIWEVASGIEVHTLLLLAKGNCVALHPSLPLAACGDKAGSFYLIDLIGIEYGPVIVTAVDFDNGPKVRCPACVQLLPLQDGWLGQEIDCPRPACDGRMRVNPFVVGPPRTRPRSRRWQFWRRR